MKLIDSLISDFIASGIDFLQRFELGENKKSGRADFIRGIAVGQVDFT